jgi:hypothetical protein
MWYNHYMKLLSKPFVTVLLAISFMVVSLYCACYSTIQLSKQKQSCCKTKESKSHHSAAHDCPHCNSSFNAEVAIKDFQQIKAPNLSQPVYHPDVIAVAPITLGKSLFINGPPGFITSVPLYIQSHALRI